MWTLAVSVSSHYHNVGDSTYQNTRRSLEALDSKNIKLESTDLEQIQAWLLLAIHEFTCIDFRRGWMSAGQAFRLIQLTWRHGIDGPDHVQGDWIESEQKRRTFWLAYCLDRLVSLRIGSPATFSETVSKLIPPSPIILVMKTHHRATISRLPFASHVPNVILKTISPF